MTVKIKDIKGALGERRQRHCKQSKEMVAYDKGHNQVLEEQGEVEITLNRECLAKLIHNIAWPYSVWEKQMDIVKERYYKRFDSIISNLKDLLEVKRRK